MMDWQRFSNPLHANALPAYPLQQTRPYVEKRVRHAARLALKRDDRETLAGIEKMYQEGYRDGGDPPRYVASEAFWAWKTGDKAKQRDWDAQYEAYQLGADDADRGVRPAPPVTYHPGRPQRYAVP